MRLPPRRTLRQVTMSQDRRRFIQTLVAGSAGLALGSVAPGDPAVRSPLLRARDPVFPFYEQAARFDIGDYLPKDQGGKFVQAALIGSESDSVIVDAIRRGLLERTYGNPIAWSGSEATEIEKSVWLNRLYWLPPFARQYFLTRDRRYLDDMTRLLGRWIADNPRPTASAPASYTWRDMQVAWRSIHLSWCWFLGLEGLRDDERSVIVRLQEAHADVLLAGFGRQALNEFNHQAHGALAMLYLGTLFPTLATATALRQAGVSILSHHLARAFRADGSNVEQMFGYYPFEAHIFRDAYSLCAANGVAPPNGSLPALERMAHYLSAVAQPNGTMPQVNDSYEMPAQPTLETIDTLLGTATPRTEPASTLFPDAHVAVLRSRTSRRWYVLAHAASVIGAHAHAGRLAFNVWFMGRPLLTDSGCCNYDDAALVKWYRTTGAHNSVLIDGRSDAATSSDSLWVARRETGNRIVGWTEDADIVSCRMHSPASEATNAGVAWTRAIALVRDDLVIVHDTYDTTGEHDYGVIFRFAARAITIDEQRRALVAPGDGGACIVLMPSQAPGTLTLAMEPLSVGGVSTPAPVGSCRFNGKGPAHASYVIAPCENGRAIPSVTQTAQPDGIVVSVSGAGSARTRVLFGRNGPRLLS
jgi:hypothetical protein